MLHDVADTHLPISASTHEPLAPQSSGDTLISLLAVNSKRHPKTIAMREREFGIWREYNWADYLAEVTAFAAGLEAIGLRANEPLVIIGDNRARLYFAHGGGGDARRVCDAALSGDTRRRSWRNFIKPGTRIAIVEDQEQVDKLLEVRARQHIPQIIVYDDARGVSTYSDRRAYCL